MEESNSLSSNAEDIVQAEDESVKDVFNSCDETLKNSGASSPDNSEKNLPQDTDESSWESENKESLITCEKEEDNLLNGQYEKEPSATSNLSPSADDEEKPGSNYDTTIVNSFTIGARLNSEIQASLPMHNYYNPYGIIQQTIDLTQPPPPPPPLPLPPLNLPGDPRTTSVISHPHTHAAIGPPAMVMHYHSSNMQHATSYQHPGNYGYPMTMTGEVIVGYGMNPYAPRITQRPQVSLINDSTPISTVLRKAAQMDQEEAKSDLASQLEDTSCTEETISDSSTTLSKTATPDAQESSKTVGEEDESRVESPKVLKPVLGKAQAKKRLMAFANKFGVIPKVQTQKSKSEVTNKSSANIPAKIKAKPKDTVKSLIDEVHDAKLKIESALEAQQHQPNYNKSSSKSKRKTEEKILAIEQIVREESRNKNLSFLTITSGTEGDIHRNKESEDIRDMSGKEWRNAEGPSRLSRTKSSDRWHRSSRDHTGDRSSKELRDRSESKEWAGHRSSQDREHRKKSKDRRNDKEKYESIKDKKGKEKEIGKDRGKELAKCISWAEIKTNAFTVDELITLRRRDFMGRPMKNRTAHDYAQHLAQMLMIGDYRSKRLPLIADGIEGPKEFHPESVRITKRGRNLPLFYCENPRVSLLLSRQQIFQSVPLERREKIREICEATSTRMLALETEIIERHRFWYRNWDNTDPFGKAKSQLVHDTEISKSKWDSEEDAVIHSSNEIEEDLENIQDETEDPVCMNNDIEATIDSNESTADSGLLCSIFPPERITRATSLTRSRKEDDKVINERLSIKPMGDEKLASEYEQFMKMVSNDTPESSTSIGNKFSKENVERTTSPSCYDEFNIDISREPRLDKKKENEESTSERERSVSPHSVPSDWENVRIKVEKMSDENSEAKSLRKKRKRKGNKVSSSETSSTSSSSDYEETSVKEKSRKRKKRKHKVSRKDSSSDSDSSDSSSSYSSSSDEIRKKKRKKSSGKKRRSKKAKKTKKKRGKRSRSDSSSTDSEKSDREKYKKGKKKRKRETDEKVRIEDNVADKLKRAKFGEISKEERRRVRVDAADLEYGQIKEESLDSSLQDTVLAKCAAPWDKESNEKSKLLTPEKNLQDSRKHSRERSSRKRNDSEESFVAEWDRNRLSTENDEEKDVEKVAETADKQLEQENVIEIVDDESKDDSTDGSKEKKKDKLEIESETRKKKRTDRDRRSGTDLETDWEKDSPVKSRTSTQKQERSLKKQEKRRKMNWADTDFDTLNVPSLTQLEKAEENRDILDDEWEVDSLDAIREASIHNRKRTTSSSSKKIEKDVKYDEKTDTYIAVGRETARDTRRRQNRLCAIRIWEEEQEEGEKEEMMLMEEKSKQRSNDWDAEERSIRESSDRTNSKSSTDHTDALEGVWLNIREGNSDRSSTKKSSIDGKKDKRSRWDVEDHPVELEEESVRPVMWEEEDEFDLIERRSKNDDSMKESRVLSEPKNFQKIMQSVESSERSWQGTPGDSSTTETSTIELKFKDGKVRASVTESRKVDSQGEEIPKTIANDFEVKSKNHDDTRMLYSPSSPAPSQKSEDVDTSDDSAARHSPKEDMKLKTKESSTRNIPIALDEFPTNVENISGFPTEGWSIDGGWKSLSRISTLEACDKTPDNSSDTGSSPGKSRCMDIFAEYVSEPESDEVPPEEVRQENEVETPVTPKKEESNDEKSPLKLIPKQLLLRRSVDIKSKSLLELPELSHTATVSFKLQKKALKATVLEDGIEEDLLEDSRSDEKSVLISEFGSGKLDMKTSPTKVCGLPVTPTKLDPIVNQEEIVQREPEIEAVKDVAEEITNKIEDKIELGPERTRSRSPSVERRKRSPVGKLKNDSKSHVNVDRPGSRNLERAGSRDFERSRSRDLEGLGSRDLEASGSRDLERSGLGYRSSKSSFHTESRRRFSPTDGHGKRRGRKSRSPSGKWESEKSRSKSNSRSWSRSRSKSPGRWRDDPPGPIRDRERKSYRPDEERPGKSKYFEERKDRSTRSPGRHCPPSFSRDGPRKRPPSGRNDRDRGRRRFNDSLERDRDRDRRSYEPPILPRDRSLESDRYSGARYREDDDGDKGRWRFEDDNILPDIDEQFIDGQRLDLEYDDRRSLRDESLERDIMEGPIRPDTFARYRRRSRDRIDDRRERETEREWEKDRCTPESERQGPSRRSKPPFRSRSKSSPRPRRSPDRYRFESRSRSRSWTRSRSRSRSRSRTRSRSRSRSRLRSPDRPKRSLDRLRHSRSVSPRERSGKDERIKDAEDENHTEKGRRIETIVQALPGPSRTPGGSAGLDTDMLGNDACVNPSNFRYATEGEGGNEYYYYSESNLTYPPRIDDMTNSPKRLSLDDRLELELGIKKHDQEPESAGYHAPVFPVDIGPYLSPNQARGTPLPPVQHPQPIYHRQQPTVLQVGNVLQVVPAEFTGTPPVAQHTEPSSSIPTNRSSSHVVRVGNVLQVVPTTNLDWSASSSTDPQTLRYPTGVTVPSTTTTPVPIPVPVPVTISNPVPSTVTISAVSPIAPVGLSLPVPIPVPVPVPVPIPVSPYSRTDPLPRVQITEVPVHPVYNYDVIMEVRRKEREERKRLRDERRKEKERRRIEKVRRRAERMLKKSLGNIQPNATSTLDEPQTAASVDTEQPTEDAQNIVERVGEVVGDNEPEAEIPEVDGITAPGGEEEEDAEAKIDSEEQNQTQGPEQEDEEEEPEEDEEEEEEEEEEDEEEEEEEEAEDENEADEEKREADDNEKARNELISLFSDNTPEEEAIEAPEEDIKKQTEDTNKDQETEMQDWPSLPAAPLKGILISPGFGKEIISNGDDDDMSAEENDRDDDNDDFDLEKLHELKDKFAEEDRLKEDKRTGRFKTSSNRSRPRIKKRRRSRKSVQFADGVRPGEGTSPSGGEGDMPSPPPPTTSTKDSSNTDPLRRLRISRKSRKKQKRVKPPKAKKKVKVKIIKLKKPRITPLTAMMLDDSDDMDDRSPPPPPPGSPPPPHLWPSYLAAYNATLRALEPQSLPTNTTTPVPAATQATPPPTPLPLLIPPPPLNYTIQPINKA